jgi:hypothetical protein
MNIFWIFLSLVLGALTIGACIAVPCILWFGRKRSWKFRTLWIGVALTPLLLFMLFVNEAGSFEPDDPMELARGYEFELHQPVTDDVQGLRIKRIGIGDGVGSFLKCEASSSTIDSIVSRFGQSDRNAFFEGAKGANVPGWWDPSGEGMVKFYYVEGWEPGCGTFSYAYLAHDASKRVLYFHHSGS